jgi:tRNA guanosine-2'-O-methyltransferase
MCCLQDAKKRGYRLVGLEQTSTSISLPEYKFEKDTALVLGGELLGIPPRLLGLLDVCIEIPQLGVLRSLNVHVAGAISMYEYLCQMQAQPESHL